MPISQLGKEWASYLYGLDSPHFAWMPAEPATEIISSIYDLQVLGYRQIGGADSAGSRPMLGIIVASEDILIDD